MINIDEKDRQDLYNLLIQVINYHGDGMELDELDMDRLEELLELFD